MSLIIYFSSIKPCESLKSTKCFFQTFPIILSPAQSIFRPPKKFKKEHIWRKRSASGNSERASKKSLLRMIDIKKIWRSIAFSLRCIFFFFVSLQSVKLYTSNSSSCRSLRIKISKGARLLESGLTFCPSITNLFYVQLKLIRVKLNRSESPQKNDICLLFIILTFLFNTYNKAHCKIVMSS